MKILLLFILIQFIIFSATEKVSYRNFKVYSAIPKTDKQAQALVELQKNGGFDFWSDIIAIENDVRVMVSPEKEASFITYAKDIGLEVTLKVSDIQSLIDEQLVAARKTFRNSRATVGSFDWVEYHPLNEINAWLDALQEAYPDIVSPIVSGKSFEGRDIKGIKIDFLGEKRKELTGQPLIAMIEGGIHAREWISPATVTYIINEMLTNKDANVRIMAEAFEWHIFPVINPDGYSYTFTDDRMWRKNRSTRNFTSCAALNVSDDLSNGVDLNRNFDYDWNTVGVSSSPCGTTFPGPSAASEPETQAISKYVLDLTNQGHVVYYFAFHSFSQKTLIPFSNVAGSDALIVENYADLYEIAIRGADKLKERHGTHYDVGTSKEILYETSGGSFDWVKADEKVSIVYLFELRDTGDHGFLLPAEQILPNAEEMMDCLLEIDRVTRSLGYYEYSGSTTVTGSILLSAITAGYLMYGN